MRKKILLGMAVGAVLVLGSASGAFAGEVNGKGDPNAGPKHANSICVYSGLEDGSEGGAPGPGNPPQNWGHSKDAFYVVGGNGAAKVEFLGGEWGGCNAHLYPFEYEEH